MPRAVHCQAFIDNLTTLNFHFTIPPINETCPFGRVTLIKSRTAAAAAEHSTPLSGASTIGQIQNLIERHLRLPGSRLPLRRVFSQVLRGMDGFQQR